MMIMWKLPKLEKTKAAFLDRKIETGQKFFNMGDSFHL